MESMEAREKMPNIEVVLAAEEDAEGIRDVQRDTWIATYPNEELGITKEDIEAKDWDSPKRIERWRSVVVEENPNKHIWLAKDAGKVVGFLAGLIDDTENKLTAIYTLPEYHGKKVGSKLMQEFLSWADKQKESVVEVAKYNANAIGFYQHYGFEGAEDIPSGPVADLPSGKTIPEIRMRRKAEVVE